MQNDILFLFEDFLSDTLKLAGGAREFISNLFDLWNNTASKRFGITFGHSIAVPLAKKYLQMRDN
jgi:hypothetical protein